MYTAQRYCAEHKFPKVDIKGKSTPLIQLLFTVLYKYEIVNESGFLKWSNDDNEDIPGRIEAVIATTEFMQIILEEDEEEEEEDEDAEVEEIDAPRETC